MAQTLKELLSFTETVEYSSLPQENKNKIQVKILRLQYEERKIQREVEQKLQGFKFPGMVSFYVLEHSEGKGSINFKCSEEPEFTFDHLSDLSERLGTRKLNLPNSECVNGGCGTCGHGAEWEIVIKYG